MACRVSAYVLTKGNARGGFCSSEQFASSHVSTVRTEEEGESRRAGERRGPPNGRRRRRGCAGHGVNWRGLLEGC